MKKKDYMTATASRLAASLLLIVALTVLPSCYASRLHMVTNSGDRVTSTHRQFSHTFLFGLISIGSVNIDSMCREGTLKDIRTQMGGWTFIANALTFSLWTPMQVRVRCAGGN